MNYLNAKWYTFLVIICTPIFLIAQAPNTLVMGKINNNLAKHIELQVNQKYLKDAVDMYKSNVLEDGSFMFAVEINEPQVAKIIYARNEALVYLEPHDTLVINSEANSFQYSLQFSGRSGANNTCLSEYMKDNPPIMNVWQLLQYRKGIFWFTNEQKMDNMMQRMKEAEFSAEMSKRKKQAMEQLIRFQNREGAGLTQEFIDYLETEIYFNWAYHMLLYGSVYGNMHQLDQAAFFSFLEEVPLRDKALGSYWYRNFLLAYVNHVFMQQKKDADEYVSQYILADSLMEPKQAAFVKAHLLYKAFYAKRVDAIIPYYLDFLETNPYQVFDEKVIGAYQKAMRYAVGTPAPDFTIKNLQDENVNLLDFQGKVVLLNFWASWCRPCLRKMDQLKPMQQELASQNIVFLNISLDRDKAAWRSSVQQNNFKGVHLLADGALESEVSALYDVKALPQYFIIDKLGNFAEKPRTKGLDDLKTTLEYLNIRK